MAARLFDEAVHHGKPEAGAFAGRLGGEERLEHLVENFFRNPGPGVGDAQHNILPGLDVAEPTGIGGVEIGVGGLDGEAAAFRHGRSGIQSEIEQDVLELVRIGESRP